MSEETPNPAHPAKVKTLNTPYEHLIYLLEGNKAFVRLFTFVLDLIPGFKCQILKPHELIESVWARRPASLAIIEDYQFYQELRSYPELADIPILFIAISELDADIMPQLNQGDLTWVMKNDYKELWGILENLIPKRARKHILCVDDSPTILKHIQKVFIGTPYNITTADNGLEALAVLERVTPDLILTDIEMPVMDGLTFCREVRARADTAEIPLIILSSRVDFNTIANGFEAGADEYLTKPFHPDELLNKVESYLVPPPTRRQEHVLLVSPSVNIIHQLKLPMVKQGFTVTVKTHPEEALVAALEEIPDLIIAEDELPGMTGFQFCTQIRDAVQLVSTPVVIVTGKTTVGARKMGTKVGVNACLTKPFTREGVVMLVERILAENRSLKTLQWDMVLALITSLAKALDERDTYTRFHSENVSRYAVAIGRKAGLNSAELENLRLAGLVHDIGKIGIPDKVLNKPDQLTEDEIAQIRKHPQIGAEILAPVPGLEELVTIILHHHERIDGQGYPGGLKEKEIPIMSQMLAVADTFDALVTDRPYRQGMTHSKAVSILKDVSGTQLSPRFVDLFLEWLKEAK